MSDTCNRCGLFAPCERHAEPFDSCSRCGQLSDAAGTCRACREADRAPQGEAVRLFTPAPATMPGQTGMAL
jgi:hypothetical protein